MTPPIHVGLAQHHKTGRGARSLTIIHSYDATTQIRSHGTVLSSYRFGFTVVITVFNTTKSNSAITIN